MTSISTWGVGLQCTNQPTAIGFQNQKYQRAEKRKCRRKNRERRRKGKEEEAEAGGETAVDQMEVAGDMKVTGDVVVSGCDGKN